jgi:hypothetical protein
MAGIVPTEGENKLLQRALGDISPTTHNLTLKLFVNDYTPVDGSNNAAFTEMSTQGYSAKTLTAASWSVAQNGSNEAEATYAQQSWTFDGTGGATTVYGYYTVDEDNTVLFAERFASSYVAENNGDILRITPTVTLSKEV